MNQFVTEWNTWRDSRNSALAKPFGWLSVVGLHWLDAESTWTDAPGTFTVDVRGRGEEVDVVELPFYQRKS